MQPHEILIIQKIDKLKEQLDRIESNQVKLDEKLSKHISFIDSTYEGLRNPIDAAKLGCKIYHGPYVKNFNEIYEYLNILKISKKIRNEDELFEELIEDLKILSGLFSQEISNSNVTARGIKNKTRKQ